MRAYVICTLLATTGIMSCSSQKSLESNPPFTVIQPVVEYWSGGREESGYGMRFEARWNPADPSAVAVDSLFFRGRMLKLQVTDTETGFLLTGNHTQPRPDKADYIMHGDSLKEVGNQPPLPLPSDRAFPFDLKEDEAVISYRIKGDGRKYYTRISGVREKRSRINPGKQQG